MCVGSSPTPSTLKLNNKKMIKKIYNWIKSFFKKSIPLLKKLQFEKLDYICPGGTHSWVFTNMGRIRKENKNIPQRLFDNLQGE